jgi:hypothetical protein
MAKRMAVGHKYRRGLLLPENGEARWFKAGELIPEDQESKIPGRFLRDKRIVFVEVGDEPVKKARPKPTPKAEKKAKSASPSPSSEGVGASAPAPLEVTEEGKADDKAAEKKTKRKRKKLFGSE